MNVQAVVGIGWESEYLAAFLLNLHGECKAPLVLEIALLQTVWAGAAKTCSAYEPVANATGGLSIKIS